MEMETIVGDYVVSMRRALGRGTFGSVYPARHEDGRKIAAKQIDSEKRKSAMKELEAFHKMPCDHENIIKIHDVITDEYDDMWFMMDLCEYGDLQQYFHRHPEKFKDVGIKLDMMCQIASGLNFLHNSNIVHRDIKPNNILLAKHPENSENIIKIADFGLCKYLDPNNESTTMHTNVGCHWFKAPELFNYVQSGKINYHKSVDIFATGLTFLAMIQPLTESGKLMPRVEGTTLNDAELTLPIGQCMINRHNQEQQQIQVVVEKNEHPNTEKMIRRVIKRACDANPSWRITADQVLTYLIKIKSSPDSGIEDLTPQGNIVTQAVGQSPSGSMRPAGATPITDPVKQQIYLGETRQEEPMQYSEAPTVTARLNAVPIDSRGAYDNTPANGAPGQFRPAIPHEDLMKISSKIPPAKLTQFAIMYLGTNMSEISTAKERWREQVELANLEILTNWMQRNPGVTKRKLYNLLCEGSKRGWISRDIYKFLIE